MSELRDRLVKYAAELRHMAEHHPHLGLLPTQRVTQPPTQASLMRVRTLSVRGMSCTTQTTFVGILPRAYL